MMGGLFEPQKTRNSLNAVLVIGAGPVADDVVDRPAEGLAAFGRVERVPVADLQLLGVVVPDRSAVARVDLGVDP